MTNEHLQIIADELKQMGFDTLVKDHSVIVALHRSLPIDEVRQALWQVFGEIEFWITKIDMQKVRVR